MTKKFDLLTFVLAIFCLDKIVAFSKTSDKILWTILKIITGGGLAIWWLVDLIMLLIGKYQPNPLKYFG